MNSNRSYVHEAIRIADCYSFVDVLITDLILLAIPAKIIKYVRVDMVHLIMFSPEPTETSVSEIIFEST